jgi:hypothetical protein
MFAELPLDNRTVEKSAARTAMSGFIRPTETTPRTKRPNISSRLIVL